MDRSLAVVLCAALASGCAHRGPRSPEALRSEYVETLVGEDAKGAYALLSPELQRATPYEEFEARWKATEAERRALFDAARTAPAGPTAVYGGVTVHEEGRTLQWQALGDGDGLDAGYVVTDGLPTRADTRDPQGTVRSLLQAIRTLDTAAVQGLLGDEFAAALAEDWRTRLEAIEAALEEPGALAVSGDGRRAELRYGQGKAVTLLRTKAGWRVTGLE